MYALACDVHEKTERVALARMDASAYDARSVGASIRETARCDAAVAHVGALSVVRPHSDLREDRCPRYVFLADRQSACCFYCPRRIAGRSVPR